MDGSGTFTYDSSLPTARDRIRNLIGDTDATNPLRWDESYDAMLAHYGDNEAVVTAKMARAIASQFARDPSSVSIPGGPSVSWSSRVSALLDLAKRFETSEEAGGGPDSYSDTVLVRPGLEPDAREYRRSIYDFPDPYGVQW